MHIKQKNLALACALVMTSLNAQQAYAQTGRGKGTPPPSKWTGGQRGRSAMDDSPTIVYSLRAENVISGWLKTYRPVMIARCQEGDVDLYIDFGMPMHVESGSTRTIRMRFDEEEAAYAYWNESTDNEALFSTEAAADLKRMAQARTLKVQFTPFNGNPQVATFDVRGFAAPLQRIAKACKWPTPEEETRALFERAAAESTVYIYDGASTYHRKDCVLLTTTPRQNLRAVNVDETDASLEPCGVCKPRRRWKKDGQ